MFSAKHSHCRKKGVICRGTEHLPNIVDCCSRCEKVIWPFPFLFSLFGLGFVFLVSVFGKEPRVPFSYNFRVVFSLVPPKSPFFKIHFVSSSWSSSFSFVSLSKFHLCLLSLNQPLLREPCCFFLLLYLSLSFLIPFLIFAFFLQTMSLTSPFQTQVAFIFGCLVLLLLFWLFLFSFFVFLLRVCFVDFVYFRFFCCVCCFPFRLSKRCFPCNSGVSWRAVGSEHVFQLCVWI